MKIRKRLLGKKKGSSKRKEVENVMEGGVGQNTLYTCMDLLGNKIKTAFQKTFKVRFQRQEVNYVDWNDKVLQK